MHKGDLLTIVVSESQSGSTTATTSTSKKDATTMNSPIVQSLTNMFGGSLGKVLNSPFSSTGSAATSATAGSGTSTTATSFTANITVVVKDVTPNGNLLIEGRRTIKMNKQSQTILLEGTVRPDDISIGNTIQSQNVADLRLEAEGKGLIADRQREGILTKLMSWIF
jgi:flagellar L-ring protein precursor FlgH